MLHLKDINTLLKKLKDKYKNLISIIIPTKDRIKHLKKLIYFLGKNSFFFNNIILVDSSKKKISLCNFNFLSKQNLKKITIVYSRSGTALQRNVGLSKIKKNTKFIMFLDDDIQFEKSALKKMYNFLKIAPSNMAGVSFNFNKKIKNNYFEIIKNSNLLNKLEIYSNKPGMVSASGWHSKILYCKRNIYTQWLSTAAVIYKKSKIKNIKFNSKFGAYAYLEDLDFSYKVSKRGMLMVLANSIYHTDNEVNRNQFMFGIKEINNRIIFVKNNKLNTLRFIIGYFLLTIKNLSGIFYLNFGNFSRGIGNLVSCINLRKL